jgi:hypothetical protein
MEPLILENPTKQERIRNKCYWSMHSYANKNSLNLDQIYAQIQAKTRPLPKRVRDYVLSHYDSDGNFITN